MKKATKTGNRPTTHPQLYSRVSTTETLNWKHCWHAWGRQETQLFIHCV